MGENYIRIDNIRSRDMGDGCRETFAVYQLCITGMERVAVVSILSRLLHHMEIDPQEIILYRDSHNSSDDRNTGFKIAPELFEFIDGLGAEGDGNPSVSGEAADSSLCTREPLRERAEGGGDDNPSVSGQAADSPTPLSAACGGISPRRGESALCTREPLEDEE